MSQRTEGVDATTPAHEPNRQLRRGAIGVIGIVFFVLSAQAPLFGIAGALPVAIGLGDGAGAPAAFLVVGIVIALFAVGFIAMSQHVTEEGAFYSYISRGLGRRLGTGAALLALWSYNTVQVGMYGFYGVVVSGLFGTYAHVSPPWWACALVTMALVQVLGSLKIDLGAQFLAVLVGVEMAILLAFSLVTLFTGGGHEGLAFTASFSPSALMAGAPGVALVFAIGSMFGFESTAIYSAEAKDPARTVPRATYLAVAIVALFFAFVSWMVVSSYGPSHIADEAGKALQSGDSTTLVFSAITSAVGGWAGTAAGFLVASSLLAGLLAFHNASNRYVHSLAQGGSLPGVFARTNRQGAPFVASGLQTVIAIVLVVPFAILHKDPVLTLFSWGAGVAVLGIIVLYFLTSVSVLVFFRRSRVDTRPWHTLIAPALSAVLIAGLITLVVINFDVLTGGAPSTAIFLIVSIPVFLLIGAAVARPGANEPSTASASAEDPGSGRLAAGVPIA